MQTSLEFVSSIIDLRIQLDYSQTLASITVLSKASVLHTAVLLETVLCESDFTDYNPRHLT